MGRLPVEIYESCIGSQPELTIDINAASQQEKKKAISCLSDGVAEGNEEIVLPKNCDYLSAKTGGHPALGQG